VSGLKNAEGLLNIFTRMIAPQRLAQGLRAPAQLAFREEKVQRRIRSKSRGCPMFAPGRSFRVERGVFDFDFEFAFELLLDFRF
jgi:hypothetical protein